MLLLVVGNFIAWAGGATPISFSHPSSFIQGHSAEVITLSFDSSGESMVTGSFDHTVLGWDLTTAK